MLSPEDLALPRSFAPSTRIAGRWPSHLTAPTDAGWAIWRDGMLRSAGFPADNLNGLVELECSDLADRLEQATTMAADRLHAATEVIGFQIDTLHVSGERAEPSDERRLKELQRTVKALRRGELPDALDAFLPFELACALREATEQCAQLAQRYERCLEESQRRFSATAAAMARDSRFREAVTWQNHSVIRLALDPLASDAPMSGSKRRQREALVANYLQRYCLKNDTIGFFGPMTWVRIAADPRETRYTIGPGLVRQRTVRFEDWAIGTLMCDFARDDRVLPWLSARKQPFLGLDGMRLRLPGGSSLALSEREATLFALCDGVATPRQIARRILANPLASFDSEADVFEGLRQLERDERIHLGFDVSSCDPQPEVALRTHLERVQDDAVRNLLLARLALLESARDEIADSAGNAPRLQAAMQALDEVFVAQTGADTRRNLGEAYGGRALVYEDCHRDLDVTLTEACLAPLRGALDFVLMSSRWFTCEAAKQFHARFVQVVTGLRDKSPTAGGAVRFTDFWLQAQSILFAEEEAVSDLARTLRDRWEEIVKPLASEDPRRCQRDSASLRDAMATAFGSENAGWVMARHQSPDLMFCASSPDALLRGDYLAVLGEVHMGGNTVATNLFVSQHPDQRAMLDAIATDLGVPYACPKLSPEASKTPIRTQWAEDARSCIEILFSHRLVAANPTTALNAADLDIVYDHDGRLIVRTRSGEWQAGLMDVLGDFLFLRVMNHFGVVHRRRHIPRITIDKLVVQRERWMFSAGEAAPMAQAEPDEGFRAARRWARKHELPDQIFVKLSWEDKPFFVDFRSPILVRLLTRQIRGALDSGLAQDGTVTITETLPSGDQLWLHDAAGRRFTSELRLVCIHADDVGCAP